MSLSMKDTRRLPKTVAKPGLESSLVNNTKDLLKRALQNRIQRKSVLTLPDEIQRAHQDKYFVYVPYSDFERNGGYHPQGYSLFRSDSDSGNLNSTKFNFAPDGLIHRNEMVLAWLPKEEQEMRELERLVLSRGKNLDRYFDKDPSMNGFSPTVNETVEQIMESDL